MMIRQMTAMADPAVQGNAETHKVAIDKTVTANEQLRQRVRLFLSGSNQPGLRHIEVDAHGDTVTLSGSVRTFYEKQLAVRLSRRVAGVIHVVDSLEAWGYRPQAERRAADTRPATQNGTTLH